MRLFDTHSHLQLRQFDADRDAVMERAREAGVEHVLVLGTDVATSQQAIALAERAPGVLAAAGCHPHDAKDCDDDALTALAELAQRPEVVAVGEIGLDFYRNFSPHDRQVAVFERQLETAATVAKPVAVHGRDAHDALFPIVAAWSRRLGGRLPDGRPLGVMHYFSGDVALARRYVDLGFAISIHCSVTHPNAGRLQDVARGLPLETLVVETDAPFGAPQSRRGARNEPAFVVEAVERIAALRGEPAERVAAATTENARRLFGDAVAAAPTAAARVSGTSED